MEILKLLFFISGSVKTLNFPSAETGLKENISLLKWLFERFHRKSLLLWNGWANSQSSTISWERDEYHLSQIISEKAAKNLPKALSCEFIQQAPITGGSDKNQNTAMSFHAKEAEFLNNWLNVIGEKKLEILYLHVWNLPLVAELT